MTEKCRLSAGKMKANGDRDKAMEFGEELRDKEKHGVKQSLNKSEEMTEIRSRLSEGETSSSGGREMTSTREEQG